MHVGADAEEVGGGDEADHDGVLDVAGGEGVEHAAELAEVHPLHLVDDLFDVAAGFAGEGDGEEAFDALLAGGPGQQPGIDALAGDHGQFGRDGVLHAGEYRRKAESTQGGRENGLISGGGGLVWGL